VSALDDLALLISWEGRDVTYRGISTELDDDGVPQSMTEHHGTVSLAETCLTPAEWENLARHLIKKYLPTGETS
jgi:hypothetical protein